MKAINSWQKTSIGITLVKTYKNLLTRHLVKTGVLFYYLSIYYYKIFMLFYKQEIKEKEEGEDELLELPELDIEYYKYMPLIIQRKGIYKARIFRSMFRSFFSARFLVGINLSNLIKLFYKQPGSQYLKVKTRFPSINIASGFKISKYVIF
jgi:hypothetical protein